jgi:HD-GYP domain-containing protein (c-di-GMP phosphodiesterase class II)
MSASGRSACAFCGVAVGETFTAEKILYCCQGCHQRAHELAAAHGCLRLAYWDTLHVIVAALDARESRTAAHSRRVAEITRVLAQAMGCTKTDFLRPAAEIVLAHQERFDGRGYPRQLQGKQIPLGARLFAVTDALDALTADRPYRAGPEHCAAGD